MHRTHVHVQKVPAHFAHLDRATYVSAFARAPDNISAPPVTRRDATRRDGLTTHASRRVLHLSIRPAVRLANRGTARTSSPFPSSIAGDVYVVSRPRTERNVTIIIVHPARSRPTRPAGAAFVPLRSPRARSSSSSSSPSTTRVSRQHAPGRRFFATISSESREREERVRGASVSYARRVGRCPGRSSNRPR